jgi:hypothetical protein
MTRIAEIYGYTVPTMHTFDYDYSEIPTSQTNTVLRKI